MIYRQHLAQRNVDEAPYSLRDLQPHPRGEGLKSLRTVNDKVVEVGTTEYLEMFFPFLDFTEEECMSPVI